MRRSSLALLSVLTLPAVAGAQQWTPSAADRVTRPSALLTSQGRSHPSRGLLESTGAPLTRFSLSAVPHLLFASLPLKVSGCLGEKLGNNTYSLTLGAPLLQGGNPGRGAHWAFPFRIQPMSTFRLGNSNSGVPNLDLNDVVLTYRDGKKMSQRTTPGAVVRLGDGNGIFKGKTATPGVLIVKRDEYEAESNPPVQMSFPRTRNGDPGVTVDLTCTR